MGWISRAGVVAVVAAISFGFVQSPAAAADWVTVKYRDTPVDVSQMDVLDRSGGDVRQAWYDRSNRYLVIDLNGTKYHYCAVSPSDWSEFKSADLLEAHYRQHYYQGIHDCREVGMVPSYAGVVPVAASSEGEGGSASDWIPIVAVIALFNFPLILALLPTGRRRS